MWILRRSAVSSLVLSNCRTEKRFYTAWAVSCLLQRAAIGRDTDVCPSRGHLGGSSSVPNYQIRGKELYPARGHANGSCSVPHYTICGADVCPARGHPSGTSSVPW